MTSSAIAMSRLHATSPGIQFALRKDLVRGRVLRSRLPTFGILFIFILASYFVAMSHNRSRDAISILLILPILVAGYWLVCLVESWWIRSKMPEKIWLSDDSISIDGEPFRYDDLVRIYLTPHSYTGAGRIRKLTLVISSSSRATYHLGFRMGSLRENDPVFPEYPQFANCLEDRLFHTPGKFQYDR